MTNMKPMEGWHRAWFILGIIALVLVGSFGLTAILTDPHDPTCKAGQVLVYDSTNHRACLDINDFIVGVNT